MIFSQRIPFTITYLDHGFAEVKGLLHIGKEALMLEFRKENHHQMPGIDSTEVKQIPLPFERVQSILYRKKWIGAEIEIKGTSMRTFEDVPGAEQGACTLKIKRKHRREAERAVSRARAELSEFKLREMEDDS